MTDAIVPIKTALTLQGAPLANVRALHTLVTDTATAEGVAAVAAIAAQPVTEANLPQAIAARDDAHAAHKAIDAARKAAKAPFLEAGDAVDALAVKALKSLADTKAILVTAIARTEALIVKQKNEALQKAMAEADAGNLTESAATLERVNTLTAAVSKPPKEIWAPVFADPARTIREAPEFAMLDESKIKALGITCPADVQPKAIPGVIWQKVAVGRAKAVRS
jgi:hypothetical protein